MNAFIDYLAMHMALVWIIVAVIFGLIEAFTMGFFTIWFTIGAAVSCVVSLAGGPIWLQVVVFIVVSVVLLIFTRPILVKHLKVGSISSNVDAFVGKIALVTEAIEPFKSGLAKVNGVIWTAVGENEEEAFEVGRRVVITKVEGVKLIVAAEQRSQSPEK